MHTMLLEILNFVYCIEQKISITKYNQIFNLHPLGSCKYNFLDQN